MSDGIPRQPQERRGNVVVRFHDDGSLDEVVMEASDGCSFHLEQMDDNCFWMRCYGTEYDVVVNLFAEIGKLSPPYPGESPRPQEGPVVVANWEWESTPDTTERRLASGVRSAVDCEREACAQIADAAGAVEAARAIRARYRAPWLATPKEEQ